MENGTVSHSVRVLDPVVAQQVAAGEVVERPASVIKELLENALDAGASSIEVEVKDGGSTRMAVHDDGRGMADEDAKTAVLSHATSKIASVEDLHSVGTLGFRGEALPSMASVSAFELTTSTGEGAATKVTVDGGSDAQVSAASRPRGTSVVVERLFYNVPARREFLKSKKVERAAVSEVVSHLALSHPEVAFKLTDDHREQIAVPATSEMRERLAGIYGISAAKAFRRVEHESFPYRVVGYAALPSLTYTNRYACQTVSVNGRWVRAASLSKAIDDAYRATVAAGRYPPLVLSVEVDQRKVDVNVHPTKQVVRFSDDTGVRRAVSDAIGLAIGQVGGAESRDDPGRNSPEKETGGEPGGGVASTGDRERERGEVARPARNEASAAGGSGRRDGAQDESPAAGGPRQRRNAHEIPEYQQRIRSASEPLDSPSRGGTDQADPTASGNGSAAPQTQAGDHREPGLPDRGTLPECSQSRVIGQFGQGYILLEEPGALWIVDQHAAHERVLLDRLNAGEQVSSQQLLAPEVVEFSATEAAEGRELLEELAVYGFEAEPFGPRSFRITGVISTLADRDVAEAFRDAMAVARGAESGPHREQNILATVACKSAVKLGDRLSQEEMESLIEQWLTQSELPATCPHGRSICYRMDAKEIARKLDRH